MKTTPKTTPKTIVDEHYMPTIVIANNEQKKLVFKNCPSIMGTLSTGDYSIKDFENDFSVETKKDLGDLMGSITHGRAQLEREFVRMRGFEFRRWMIIGSIAQIEAHDYRSQTTPQSALGSIHALEVRYSIPVVWVDDYEEAARKIEIWAYYFLAGKIKRAKKIVKNYMDQQLEIKIDGNTNRR